MRHLVLVLAVVLAAVLTTATTLVASPVAVAHATDVARARHGELRACAHVGHAGHVTAIDQDDDVDDDGGDDDFTAADDENAIVVVAPALPPREFLPSPAIFAERLGPSRGHFLLPDRPPRAS